jgi:hypothetical protein
MPDWLFMRVDDTLVWIGLLTISLICFIWGGAALTAAYDHRGDRSLPRWHVRRWFPGCFEFWLGWFLILFGTGVGIVFGVHQLRTPQDVELWAWAWITTSTLSAILAFRSWARDRIPG